MPYPERAITVDTESMCGFAGPLRNAATAINPYTLGPDRTATTASAVGPGYETLSVSPAISFSQRLGNPYPCPAPWRSEPRACVGDRRHSQSHRVNDKWPLLKAAAPGDGVGRITLTATAARPSRSWRGCRTHYFAPDGRGRPGETPVRRGLSSNERTARGGRAPLAPTRLVSEAAGSGNAGWSAAPAGLGPPAPPPGRRPGRAGAHAVTGPLARRRQRPRRRITPNTNTSTTTMINTHNHVDMAASLVGPGAVRSDATAAHPSKQLGHSHATSWARIGGRAARGLAGTLHPATCPPIWAGRAGAGPSRQAARRRPRWGRALRPRHP